MKTLSNTLFTLAYVLKLGDFLKYVAQGEQINLDKRLEFVYLYFYTCIFCFTLA